MIVQLTDQFRNQHQLRTLLPAFEQLQDRLTPDLRVVYGMALFEDGQTARGLELVEAARHAGATPLPATLTLARMRARSGQLTMARTLYWDALQQHPERSQALSIRAQLSFDEALQGRTGLVTTLLDIEPDAHAVLADPQHAPLLARAQAHTALALASAYRGQRATALPHAQAARDLLHRVSDPEALSALYAALAIYYADEDQLATADLLLQEGHAIVPSHLTERHLQLKINRAWTLLRRHTPTALRQTLLEARTLRAITRQRNNTPQRLDTLTLGALCLCFLCRHEPDTVLRAEYEQTLEELAIVAAPYPTYQDTVSVLRALAKPEPSIHQLTLDARVPPNVQILIALALGAWGADHIKRLASSALQRLSDQWGRSTLHMYAHWLGTGALPPLKPVLDVKFLTPNPEVRIDGRALKLNASALQLLAGLIYGRRVTAADARTLFSGNAVSRLHVTASRLKDTLKHATALAHPLGTERGNYTLAAFTIRTDVDRLYLIPPRELPSVYAAPLLHGLDTELLTSWRQECRQLVQKRVQELGHAQGDQLKKTLQVTDPCLKWSDPLTSTAASVHAPLTLPRASEFEP